MYFCKPFRDIILKFDFVEDLQMSLSKDFKSLMSSCTITTSSTCISLCVGHVDEGEINSSSTCTMDFVSRVLVHKSLNNLG